MFLQTGIWNNIEDLLLRDQDPLTLKAILLSMKENPFLLSVVKNRSHLESVKDGFIVLKNSTNYNKKTMEFKFL